MKTRLTNKIIEASKPKEKIYYIWDDKLDNFAIRINPGGKKSFFIQYSKPGHNSQKKDTYTIGKFPLLTASQARNCAKELLKGVAVGIDPKQKTKQKKKLPTFGEFLDEFYEEYVLQELSDNTATNYESAIRNHIKPKLGKYKIDEVTSSMVQELKMDLKDKFKHSWNTSKSVISRAFKWSNEHSKYQVLTNPCTHLTAIPTKSRQVFLKPEEIERLLKILDTISQGQPLLDPSTGKPLDQQYNPTLAPFMATAIKMLCLIGARKSEVLELEWSQINFEKRIIHWEHTKSGEQVKPIPEGLFNDLIELKAYGYLPFVFRGINEDTHLKDLKSIWRVIKIAAQIRDNVRIHDLRHTYASLLIKTGHSLVEISKMMGHKDMRSTEIYAHLYEDKGHKIAQKLENNITSEVSSK
jgi:integrase